MDKTVDNVDRKIAEKIRELAVFCLERMASAQQRPTVFAGFSAGKLFRYLAFHVLSRTLFCARDDFGAVRMIFICWRGNAQEIQRLAQNDLPQFNWGRDRPACGAGLRTRIDLSTNDSIFIAEVIGARRWMAAILKQVMAHWPDSPGLRLFTYRMRNGMPRLTELTWTSIQRVACCELAQST